MSHILSIVCNSIFLLQTEGVWSTGVIPRGTRFGPFEGIPTPNYPNDKNAAAARYFWRVSVYLYYPFPAF